MPVIGASLSRALALRAAPSPRRATSPRDPTRPPSFADAAAAVTLSARARGQRAAVTGLEALGAVHQRAELALDQQVELLQRARELAVAAASGSTADRGPLQDELDQLLAELDRGVASANGAGRGLLKRGSVDVVAVVDKTISHEAYRTTAGRALQALEQRIADEGADVQLGLAWMSTGRGVDEHDNVVRVIDPGGGGVSAALLAPQSWQGGETDPMTALTELAGVTDISHAIERFTRSDAVPTRAAASDKVLLLMTSSGQERALLPQNADADAVAAGLKAAGWTVHVLAAVHPTLTAAGRAGLQALADGTGGRFVVGGHRLTDVEPVFAEILGAGAANPAVTTLGGAGLVGQVEGVVPLVSDARALGVSGLRIDSLAAARSALGTLDGALAWAGARRAEVGAGLGRASRAADQLEASAAVAEGAVEQRAAVDPVDLATAAARQIADTGRQIAALTQARRVDRALVRALLG